MTTTRIRSSRGTPHGEATVAAGTAIPSDVQLTYEDALTQEEVIIELEKLKSKVLETPFPRV